MAVQDHFRNLTDAILSADLLCETIELEKREFGTDEKIFSVYFWIEDMYSCIAGHYFNRKMLRHSVIGRYDLKLWCERRNIPLPEFWFPPGWNLEYELPEDEIRPGHYYIRKNWTEEDWSAYLESRESESSPNQSDNKGSHNNAPNTEHGEVESKDNEAALKLRRNQEAASACRQIARTLWEDDPTRRISSVVEDELIQKYGGGRHYQPTTVRDWVQKVAPPGVSARRGRPPKNTPGSQ